jgi:hypothetical protein
MNTIPLPEIFDRIVDHIIASVEGSLLSPQTFDPRVNPGGRNLGKMISFGIPDTNNTDLMRPRNEERLDHTMQIGIVERMQMGEQRATMTALLARIEAITSAMSDKGALAPMRVTFLGAVYPLSPSREYQFGLARFNVRADMHVIF